MQYSKLLSQLLAATALAAVSSQTITANYDNITVVPAVPAANIITVYEGLNYTNFVVNQILAGAKPHTPPNVIVSGFEQTTVNGGLAMFQKTGKTKSFDLKSFYYSCAANTVAGAAAVAEQCTFLVRGYRSIDDTNPVAANVFTFNPAAKDLAPAQVKATLGSGFGGVQKVDFVMVESASGETLNVLNLDSVTYTLHY